MFMTLIKIIDINVINTLVRDVEEIKQTLRQLQKDHN